MRAWLHKWLGCADCPYKDAEIAQLRSLVDSLRAANAERGDAIDRLLQRARTPLAQLRPVSRRVQ